MKNIQIADQPRLSLARTVRVTIDGIRYRLFRASVTVAVIAVAVAFLMNIMSESLIKRAVADDTRQRIARAQLVHDWMARLTAPGNAEAVIRELAGSEPGDAVSREAARMAGLSAADMQSLHADTKRAAFHACLERRKNKPQACGAERKAMRAAGTQQRNAVAAFNFANATKTKVCSPAR